MKKFRFYSYGMAPQSRKRCLNAACQTLSHIFTEADIKPGMFSPSLEKRLRQAKKHGTKIVLRRWRGSLVGVTIVNKEDHAIDMKKKRASIRGLRKKLKTLLTVSDVQNFLKSLQKLGAITIDPVYRHNLNLLLDQIK
jgi:hypothetical protein